MPKNTFYDIVKERTSLFKYYFIVSLLLGINILSTSKCRLKAAMKVGKMLRFFGPKVQIKSANANLWWAASRQSILLLHTNENYCFMNLYFYKASKDGL